MMSIISVCMLRRISGPVDEIDDLVLALRCLPDDGAAVAAEEDGVA